MKKLLLLLSAVTLNGCTIGDYFEIYLESFISAYFDYSDIDIYVNDGVQIVVKPIVGHIYSAESSAENDKLRFEDLAQYNGDVDFRQKFAFSSPTRYPNIMPAESLVKIELYATDGSDEPVNLNSQVKFEAVTPKEFIRSGYTKRVPLDTSPLYATSEMVLCYNTIGKMADALSADDLELIGNGDETHYVLFVLRFTEQPQEPLNLELVLTFGDTRVIRKSFEYTPTTREAGA